MTYLRAGLALVAGSLLVGVVQAWLWAAIAPGVRYQVFENQSWAPLPTETLHIFTAFSLFALIGLFVGVGIAVVGWMFRSLRGPVMLLVCGVSAAAGSLLAGRLGVEWAAGTTPAAAAVAGAREIVSAPAVLTGWPAHLAAPTAAVLVYTFLVAWNGLPNLGGARI